jgi:glycosyltransferase involved in cell wall biosynthesis
VKICVVNPFEHGGGAEYQTSLLIEALGAGRDVTYLTHFADRRPRARSYRIEVVGDGGPIPRVGYLAEARSLYRKLEKIGPDVIYQRVACAYTGVCAYYSQRHSVPMIWHVCHEAEVAPRMLERVRNMPRQWIETRAVGYGARRATRIVVQTERQAELLRANYGRAADAVIPNFHPPAREAIDKSGPFTVLWVANLKTWKQPDAFVRLAARFASRSDIRFVMIGAPAAATGNHAWREALMRGIEQTGNLEYLGERPQAEVNELLARAHVFVNTSKAEGFPNTFIQAWMRDAAVVSLCVDPDGVLEREGVGIAAGTEDRLAAAISRLSADREALAGYARRARTHVAAHHSLENARRLVELLDAEARGAHG